MKKAVPFFLLAFLCITQSYGQCITNVDFHPWSEAGWVANGNWAVNGPGNQVHQTINGQPTFFISPFDLMNVHITGNFKTTDNDDDYMGFVFCFQNPIGQSDTFKTWLYDWKQKNQVSGGQTASKGMSLNKLDGVIPTSQYNNTFWGHNNTAQFTCVQNNFGSAGWVKNFNHAFDIVLTYTRVIISIDGQLVFDHQDCFEPGRFGFYNYSQQDCYYTNFQYELFTDFTISDTLVCTSENVQINFMPSCSGNSVGLNQYQSLSWDFGDGSPPLVINNPTSSNVNANHVYSTPGTYNILLTVTDVLGCTTTATHSVIVGQALTADFTANTVCDGNATQFTNASSAGVQQWNWNFGDGNNGNGANPQHNYSAGTYNATLVVASGNCYDTITKPVTVNANPVALFSVNDVCIGNSTNFTNQSTGAATYNWSFGDNSTSSLQNPQHTYATSGSFTSTLIAVSSQGCADTTSASLNVFEQPNASFTVAAVCEGNTSNFVNNSTISTGGITSYNWNFGDGSNDSQQNPTHNYAAAGTYNTTLIVISNNGCADTAILQAVVNPKPLASFTASNVCYPAAMQFTNQSTGTINTYNWNFDDGNTDNQNSPAHNYNADATYNPELIVTTAAGCADTLSMPVTVYPKPSATFSADTVCEGVTTLFTNSSTINSGSITNYAWSFGDGNTDTQTNPTHTYTTAATYSAQLIAQSDNNCYDTATVPVIVNAKPVVAYTTGPVCQGQSTNFTNNTTISNGTIAQWQWDLGDGQTSTVQSPTHIYSTQGTYSVTLLAVSDNNCADSITQQLTVYDKPVAAFTVNDVCVGQASVITDNSSIGNGIISQWNYDFGDGQNSTQQSPSVTYASGGNYNIQQVITTTDGCSDTAIVLTTIYPAPIVSFSAADVCLGNPTVFSNTSSITSGSISAFNWDLGNGSSSALQAPVETYSTAGSYSISLVAVSDNGCTDSAASTISVFELPIASAETTPACYGEHNGSAMVTASAGSSPYTYNWNNNVGGNSLNNLFAGNYTVTVADAHNCSATANGTVTEPSANLGVVVSPANPAIKLNESVTLSLATINAYGNAEISISPSYGLSCTNCTGPEAQPYQTTTYTVELTDSLGCKAVQQFTITVDEAVPVFIPNAFTPNGDGVNDSWTVFTTAVKQFKLAIFNRWGEKVFETENSGQGWDGTFKGKPADNGIYVYQGSIVLLNNETRPVKGTLTLFR
ncbi:MAG: PKD domain-containing protein [Chitinophagales bacterium]